MNEQKPTKEPRGIEKRPCGQCDGEGKRQPRTIRASGSGVGNTTRTVTPKCHTCDGTGEITVDTRPLHEVWAEMREADLAEGRVLPAEAGDLDWMNDFSIDDREVEA